MSSSNVEHLTVCANGASFHAARLGSGPPLLLLHGRLAMMKGEAPPLPKIETPACVRWTNRDPIFSFSWTDRLGETFGALDLSQFEDAGHFPHREAPDRAAAEIEGFFTRILTT